MPQRVTIVRVAKVARTYRLERGLADALERFVNDRGLVRETAVSAGIFWIINIPAEERDKIISAMNRWIGGGGELSEADAALLRSFGLTVADVENQPPPKLRSRGRRKSASQAVSG